MIYVFVFLIFLIFIYLFSMKPRSIRYPEIWKKFESVEIAHRGYFDNRKAYPENSLAAFQRAVENGFGIELDVQMTKDGKLVVFHDGTLTRMCKDERMLIDLTYEECQQFTLKKSNQKIPLYEDVLKVIDGKVPLIVEIKHEGNSLLTVEKTLEMMKDYKGLYVVESFDPKVVHWLKVNRPEIIRGQLAEDYSEKQGMNWFTKRILTNFMLNWWTKPDFVAFDFHCRHFTCFKHMCSCFRFKKVVWTIKDAVQLEEAKKTFDVCIFDSFDPRAD
ncbi:MAG: glycerophosphodiester phosphodiesterase family protein [Bacillota bacterium]|nr:glycerophosphodiester phosphodiesterase family protein [Bacillota bacterium]